LKTRLQRPPDAAAVPSAPADRPPRVAASLLEFPFWALCKIFFFFFFLIIY
jgi:hypothetical protein